MIKRGYWAIPNRNDLWISHPNLGAFYFIWNNKYQFTHSFQIFTAKNFSSPLFVILNKESSMIAFFVFENGQVKKTGYFSDTQVELLKLGITLIIAFIIGKLL